MTFDNSQHGLGSFRCQRSHSGAGPITIPIAKDTWFSGHKIPLQKSLLLTYAFATDMSYTQAIRETSILEETSRETVADWYSYCREVCLLALDRIYDEQGKIGGAGHVVEIDECKIGKRKYNKGRRVEGNWVLGIIDLDGGFRLEICPNNKRDKETLMALINKHVEKGTTIVTDCWKGYSGLSADGFAHLTVNHSYNFVNPETGANTQKIESSWRPLRKKLTRGGVQREFLADHLCEYLWRREQNEHKRDPFQAIITDITKTYSEN